jgi:hypothetical protein
MIAQAPAAAPAVAAASSAPRSTSRFQGPLPPGFETSGLAYTETGREIFVYMSAANREPRVGDTSLDDAMAALKRHPAEVVETLINAYRKLADDSAIARQAIVFVLGQLQDPLALGPLQEIASAPLPLALPPSANFHDGGPRDHEIAVRTAAVERIAMLARKQDRAAVSTLRALIHPQAVDGVRVAAARAYLNSDDREEVRTELRQALGAKEQWLLNPKPALPIARR